MNKYLIIALLMVFGVMPAGGALAFYGDGEMSSGNVLGATILDFTLRDVDGIVTATLFNESDVVSGLDWYIEPLKVQKEAGLDFEYVAQFEKTGGDDVLCDELQLKVRHEGVLVYSGPLSVFTYDAGVISDELDNWSFEILFNNEGVEFANLNCEFDFVFLGEQIGGAGFYDEERVSNVFATGEGGVGYQDVVINEVMWMGSDLPDRRGKGPGDEWIELRNMTDKDIDIGKWTLDNGRAAHGSLTMVPNSHVIPPHGFLLVARNRETNANTALNADVDVEVGNMSLANTDNGNLILKDPLGNIIDKALAERDGDKWATGLNGETKRSMERNDDPGDGLLESSWHQCDDAVGCRTGDSWDITDGDNYGTPGTENKSDNDPTSVTNSEETDEPAGEGGGVEAVSVEAEEPGDDGGDVGEAEGIETGGSAEAVSVEAEEEEVPIDGPVDTKDEEDKPAATNEEEAAVEEESVESDSSEEESGGNNEPESSVEGEPTL
jgi:hypothetical protein